MLSLPSLVSILQALAPILKSMEDEQLQKIFVLMDVEVEKLGGDLGNLARKILPGVKEFMLDEIKKIQ